MSFPQGETWRDHLHLFHVVSCTGHQTSSAVIIWFFHLLQHFVVPGPGTLLGEDHEGNLASTGSVLFVRISSFQSMPVGRIDPGAWL